MKKKFWASSLILAAFPMLLPFSGFAATYNFEKTKGMSIDVMSPADYQTTFGNNPGIPLTHEAIVEYAKKLYPSNEQKRNMALRKEAQYCSEPEASLENPLEIKESISPEARMTPSAKNATTASPFVGGCGEYEFGLLFAALRNPDVSDETRRAVDAIMAAAEPALPKTYSDRHFVVLYTDNDATASNNITEKEAKTIAANLNVYWDNYSKNFKKPQNVDDKIEVRIYDLGDGLYGYSGSGYNRIYLHSQYVAKSACNRLTTPAHELFHRVQYSYGYVSGTAGHKWMTEGTASWAQKYTNQSVRDYMKRMNEGLAVPWKPLMQRDDYGYTTTHFWVYLTEKSSWSAVKEAWAAYETNGKSTKAAVDTVTTSRLSKSFDQFFRDWIKTNYIKDFSKNGIFGYTENKVSATKCGSKNGPLSKSYLIATQNFSSTTPKYTHSEPLDVYTADYYVFTLDTKDKKLTSLEITVDGAGELATFVDTKGAAVKKITDGAANRQVYLATFKPGTVDNIGVIVGGGSAGGNYTITAVPCADLDVNGTWDDIYGMVYDLHVNKTTVTGTVNTGYCGVWNIKGTYTPAPSKLNFTATNPNYQNGDDGCTLWFKYTTTMSECDTISGTWVNFHGYSGAFSMWKREEAGAARQCSRGKSTLPLGNTGMKPTQSK